ncbi:glucosyl-3-phosphoglycerate synthase [Candidatus Hakubella thermalkaliphila]|uniref:Glucosyl-3-phosphoglycerate synthase n=1 Tax=Candidatus Hakubella thermalkaliphila TaxID=2754717 RepID=A0A6V8NT01_9ACTN|nr:glucosyl-3-phosphoglycerate synthase [Candidatus Hakubella thermalkaliphila]GFP21586.1 glucosyl-3-phosphoglycerate synthase [Candidatus Hakubella thermalkaliphila]
MDFQDKTYKIMIPLVRGRRTEERLQIALALTARAESKIVVLGIVEVPEDLSFSHGAIPARSYRRLLSRAIQVGRQEDVEIRSMVRISRRIWQGVLDAAAEEKPDLILFDWSGKTKRSDKVFGTTIDRVVQDPPCDIAVIRHHGRTDFKKILVPVRGGPHAELAIDLAMRMATNLHSQVSVMHVYLENISNVQRLREQSIIDKILHEMRLTDQIARLAISSDSIERAILEVSRDYDLIIMGASVPETSDPHLFGQIPEYVAKNASCAVLVVKTKEPVDLSQLLPAGTPDWSFPEVAILPSPETRISEIVDKWFAENTFHHSEFNDIERLLQLKRKQNLTISLGLPALNEEKTIGAIIRVIKEELHDKHPLLDEVVLIDSGSTDRTVDIARKLNVPFYVHQEILPEMGWYRGKGDALWKSLHVLKGDIIVWIDTDIRNIHPKFVYGLIGPLLTESTIKYAKGFYRRPIKKGGILLETGGGRVTELTARPLINLFFPELSGMMQPLAGECAGRREALEQVPFFTGYGVEIGLLIDILDKFGLSAIGQVDLDKRIHRNQPLTELSKMSFAIMQVILQRLEERQKVELLENINKSMKLICHERDRFFLEMQEIGDQERPPMAQIKEYRKRAWQ